MSKELITEKEVSDSLKRRNGLKEAGPDGIHSTIEKPLAELLVKLFTQL